MMPGTKHKEYFTSLSLVPARFPINIQMWCWCQCYVHIGLENKYIP